MKIRHDHFHALPNSSLIIIFSFDAVQVSSRDPSSDLFNRDTPQNPLQIFTLLPMWFFDLTSKDEAQTALFKDPVRTAQ
jgi:hypothetical protein